MSHRKDMKDEQEIIITGVNKKQQKMLDKLWSFKTEREVKAWKKTLKPKARRQADVLEQMIILACLDVMVNEDHDFEEANDIIDRIMSKMV